MTKIIAELSHNHLGDLEKMRELTTVAAQCGAWGVKIQTFFADDLSQNWMNSYKDVKNAELGWDDHEVFVDLCTRLKVVPITTLYTSKYAKEVKKIGFEYIKIASPQADNVDLISKLLTYDFKLIVSTGGHDVTKLPSILNKVHSILHCTSNYPTNPYHANLSRMEKLHKKFPKPLIGFSDHTDPVSTAALYPSKLSMYLGAQYLEKHFIVGDRRQTKDGVVSIHPEQLRELVCFNQLSEEGMSRELTEFGVYDFEQQPKEMDLIERYKFRWKLSS